MCAKFNSHCSFDNTIDPSSLLTTTTNDIIVNMSFDYELDALGALQTVFGGTPPPNTLPGIGYLTYYADDTCKKDIAFLRPVLNGELVHIAIILLFCMRLSIPHRYLL